MRLPQVCAPAQPPCSRLRQQHAPHAVRAPRPRARAWSTRRSARRSSARPRLRRRAGFPKPPRRRRRNFPARLRLQTGSAFASSRRGKPSASAHNAPAAPTRCQAPARARRESTRGQPLQLMCVSHAPHRPGSAEAGTQTALVLSMIPRTLQQNVSTEGESIVTGPFHTHGSGQPSQFPPIMCFCSQPAAVALRGRRRYVAAKLS